MISEYIDSFDEFYKLDLSFSEFYSQHYGDYRHMDCEVGNPFEIFDGNGHKIREKRIERIERENICFVGIKKKVQYAPIGEGGEAQYAADYIVYTLYRGKYSCLLYLQMVGWR